MNININTQIHVITSDRDVMFENIKFYIFSYNILFVIG